MAPIHVPAIATILYGVWSMDARVSFPIGFLSLIAMFMPAILHHPLPPHALPPLLGWGAVFGLLGVVAAIISGRLICWLKKILRG